MTGLLNHLTPEQLHNLSAAVKLCISSYIKNDKKTYGELADTLSKRHGIPSYISAEAIRQYMHRSTTRVNKDNNCLTTLSGYFTDPAIYDTLSLVTQRVIRDNSLALFPNADKEFPFSRQSIDTSFGVALYNWLGVSATAVAAFSDHMHSHGFHRNVIIRQSTKSPLQLVKSLFSIKLIEAERPLLYARRVHIDRYGKKRNSTGFVIPFEHSIYFLMNVAEGSGLEIITLKRPLQKDFERMFGFMNTINSKREIISAQIFMEPENDSWKHTPARCKVGEDKTSNFITDRVKYIGGYTRSCFTTYDDHLSEEHFDSLNFDDDDWLVDFQ